MFLLLAAIVTPQYAYAQTTKEAYELAERCAKRAEVTFKREWGNPISQSEGTTTTANYTNHYNKKLNTCIYLLTTVAVTPSTKRIFRLAALYDLNENRELATFEKDAAQSKPYNCLVQGAACRSRDEWDSLIHPFMTE